MISKDHSLAQKYGLGTPTRKYRFDTPRTGSLWYRFLSHPARIVSLLCFALLCVALGLGMDVSTTLNDGLAWMWPWLLGAIALPVALSLLLLRLKQNRLAVLNLGAMLLSFFSVTLIHSLFSTRTAASDPSVYLFAGLFIQVIGLLLLAGAVYAMLLPRRVLVCADGCLVIPMMFRTYAIHWEHISTVWNSGRNARVVCDDGTRLTIHYQWPNGKALRDLIYEKAFRHIRARAMTSYEAGTPVIFGAFTVTSQGISNGSQRFLWDMIRECEYMDNAVALIGKDNSCLDIASLSELPNAAVFVALVNSILATA